MKKIIMLMVIAIAASSAAFGQANKDEQAVRQTLNELAAAINSQNMAKLEVFYADDYILINPAGVKINKTERLATVKNEKPSGVFGYENVKVRIYGDTAIVNTNVRTSAAQDPLANLTTLVLVRKGKGWQLVNAQGTTAASANQSGGNAEQAIRQTMTELFAALNRGDADAAGRIYADDYQIVLENGKTVTKAERLAAMRSGALKSSVAFDNLRIRQYGNTAVATYHVTGRSNALGGEQEINSLATVTLVNNGGRWQVVSSHLTKAPAN